MSACIHHRIVTGPPPYHRGVCKKCGDVQTYASTLEEIHEERRRFREDKMTPPVSAMGGTV